jgi:thymidine kinase
MSLAALVPAALAALPGDVPGIGTPRAQASPTHDMPTEGSIALYTGPMFSGKSSSMLQRVHRYAFADYRCVLVKYEKGDRYGAKTDVFDTHSDLKHTSGDSPQGERPKWPGAVRVVSLKSLTDLKLAADERVVAIDEGQFFSDLVRQCDQLAEQGYTVLVAALDGKANGESFEQVCELVSRSEEVYKLQAVCMVCRKRPASFTRRLVPSDVVIEVGSTDKYLACCRQCRST